MDLGGAGVFGRELDRSGDVCRGPLGFDLVVGEANVDGIERRLIRDARSGAAAVTLFLIAGVRGLPGSPDFDDSGAATGDVALNLADTLFAGDGVVDLPCPAGRDEQYERLYIVLLDATPLPARWEVYRVGRPTDPVALADILDDVIALVAQRNPDFYESDGGFLRPTR